MIYFSVMCLSLLTFFLTVLICLILIDPDPFRRKVKND